MSSWFARTDPGPCIVCGKAHSACTDDSSGDAGPIVTISGSTVTIAQRPALKSEQVDLKPGEFTTATFRGAKAARPTKRTPEG